jgi:hypothetical protein
VTLKLSNIISAYEQYEQDVEAGARACVEEGGATWGGIQEGLDYKLVLFSSKETGSTYSLKTTEITPELVRKHVQEMDAKFKKGAR